MRVGSFRQQRRQEEDRSTSLELPLLRSEVSADTLTTSDGGGSGENNSRGTSLSLHRRGGKSLNEGGMDSHDGIQKLLAAEQEAQAIVTAARQGERVRACNGTERVDTDPIPRDVMLSNDAPQLRPTSCAP